VFVTHLRSRPEKRTNVLFGFAGFHYPLHLRAYARSFRSPVISKISKSPTPLEEKHQIKEEKGN